MAGSVHEHNVGITMVEHSLRRENRDTALTLDLVRIQMRVAIVNAAALANATRVEQHGLGQRGLAGIDMRQDSNDCLLRHGSPLITSPSHAATGVLVPHWMIQFTGRRAKRALSPFCLPGLIWGDNNASPTTTRFTKNGPTRGHFHFDETLVCDSAFMPRAANQTRRAAYRPTHIRYRRA